MLFVWPSQISESLGKQSSYSSERPMESPHPVRPKADTYNSRVPFRVYWSAQSYIAGIGERWVRVALS